MHYTPLNSARSRPLLDNIIETAEMRVPRETWIFVPGRRILAPWQACHDSDLRRPPADFVKLSSDLQAAMRVPIKVRILRHDTTNYIFMSSEIISESGHYVDVARFATAYLAGIEQVVIC